MKIVIEPGCYVAAVSGGVDSMVLLDILRQLPQLRLVVAHFDHGIRTDSAEDRELVRAAAARYGLPFVYAEGKLGPGASEATARQARYDFLHKVRVTVHAQAIITAHHRDDMLETAIINIVRGTGRRGLSSLQSREYILRPLLPFAKDQIRRYADLHQIQWREDSTNQDQVYLRNYVRHSILNTLSNEQQEQLLGYVVSAQQLNQEIDSLLHAQLHTQPAAHTLDRRWFASLTHALALEVMASWLRGQGVAYDRKKLQYLVVAAKTYVPGKQANISRGVVLQVTDRSLALAHVDR